MHVCVCAVLSLHAIGHTRFPGSGATSPATLLYSSPANSLSAAVPPDIMHQWPLPPAPPGDEHTETLCTAFHNTPASSSTSALHCCCAVLHFFPECTATNRSYNSSSTRDGPSKSCTAHCCCYKLQTSLSIVATLKHKDGSATQLGVDNSIAVDISAGKDEGLLLIFFSSGQNLMRWRRPK